MDATIRHSRWFGLLLLNIFAVASTTLAATPSVTLSWDPSPDTVVTNYNLYWGFISKTPTNHTLVGNVSNVVFTNITSGAKYYFVVTALGGGQESMPSNEIFFQAPPSPPTNLRFVINIQSSNNLRDWKDSGTAVMTEEAAVAFYRLNMGRSLVVYDATRKSTLTPLTTKGWPFGNARVVPAKRTGSTAPPLPQ